MKKTLLISILAILLIAVFLVPINQEQTITKSQTIISKALSPFNPTRIRTEYIEFQRIWNEDGENREDRFFKTEALVEIYDGSVLDPDPSGDEVCASVGLNCVRIEHRDVDRFPTSEWTTTTIPCDRDEVEITNYDSYSFLSSPHRLYYPGVNYYNKSFYTTDSLNTGNYDYVMQDVNGYTDENGTNHPENVTFSITANDERDGEYHTFTYAPEEHIYTDHDNTRVYLRAMYYYPEYIDYNGGYIDIVREGNTIYRAVCTELEPRPHVTLSKTLKR